MSEGLLGLSAAAQARLIAAGEVSGEEVFEFWRERAQGDELGCLPVGGRARIGVARCPRWR